MGTQAKPRVFPRGLPSATSKTRAASRVVGIWSPRTSPEPVWAETPKLSAVGEKPWGLRLPPKQVVLEKHTPLRG